MYNMKKLINWIATDGLLHALVSILITIVCFSFMGFWSIIPTVVIGIGKEIYDMKKKPTYTWEMVWHDIICDAGGLIVGIILSVLMF